MNYLIAGQTFLKNSVLSNILPTINKVSFRELHRKRKGLTTIARLREKPQNKFPYNITYPDGIKYYGFTYYPRYKDQVDPNWERSPLFLIKRVKPYWGNPYWMKKILKRYHIEQKESDTNVVMNTEIVNRNLWKIKHLIRITPITFPDGFPTENDIGKCHLYENGELRISKALGIDEKRLRETEKMHEKVDKIDHRLKEKYLRRNWLVPFKDFLAEV